MTKNKISKMKMQNDNVKIKMILSQAILNFDLSFYFLHFDF